MGKNAKHGVRTILLVLSPAQQRIQHKQKPIRAIARTEPTTKRGCGLKLGLCMQKCRARNFSWYFITYGNIFILISDPSLLKWLKPPDTFIVKFFLYYSFLAVFEI